jgi:hypothetical protein
MSELQPCTHCSRHVRASDDVCPFCQTPIESRQIRPQLGPGRFTRAAIFAGAIGAIGACDKGQDAQEPQPPPPVVSDAGAVEGDGEFAEPPPAPDAAPVESDRVPEREMVPKPYGAPPARRRLV